MKMSRKIIILLLAALMALFSAIPSTFSWFDHDDTATGKEIEYSRSSLPISLKSGNISMTTKAYDKVTKTVGSSNVTNAARPYAAGNETSYETTFTNSGTNDIYVDFSFSTVSNTAGFYIGTTSPTINKKTYTTRPSVTEVSTGKTRVYFETATPTEFGYSDNTFWQSDSGSGTNLNSGTIGSSFGSYSYDFNIAYYTGSSNTPKYYAMSKAQNTDTRSGSARKVFYYDLPAGTSKFFFCNKYYFRYSTNQEWNKTPDITTVEPGKVYYLTGKENDKKSKLYATTNTVTVSGTAYTGKLLNLKRSYDTVRMAIGQHVDLGLSDEDYSAKTIAYTKSTGITSTLSKEGVFTAKSAGSCTVTTTITSPLGDTMVAETAIDVPSNIDQVPIIQNLRVPGTSSTDESNSVVVKWYVKNESSTSVSVGKLFYTI